MNGPLDAVRLDDKDNVATALRAIAKGQRVRVGTPVGEVAIVAAEPIGLCHKIALAPIAAGAAIVKYGEPIGDARAAIAAGTHVHVHNLKSRHDRGA